MSCVWPLATAYAQTAPDPGRIQILERAIAASGGTGAALSPLIAVPREAAMAQQRVEPDPQTIAESIHFIWKDVKDDFTAVAEEMPENKWDFKPTQGHFNGVRTFAEQVKHVACANEAWARQMGGSQGFVDCEKGGRNPAKTKAELLAYLCDSFSLIDKEIDSTNIKNVTHSNPGGSLGPNRLSALMAVIWHVSDHYGQLVEYLRMNGHVPPGSR
jgi:uncharacterized damage-inducible protein DinB